MSRRPAHRIVLPALAVVLAAGLVGCTPNGDPEPPDTAAVTPSPTPADVSVLPTAESEVACTVVGTDGNDVLRGTPGADVICGLNGDDAIVGLGGPDVIVGGRGNDR
ncbi:MAG: hypothetical protein ACXWEH_05870, partial [Actinomycetota bacterium]